MTSAPPATANRPPAGKPTYRDVFSLKRNLRSLIAPSGSQLLPLDGMRAISVLWIVAYHTTYMTQFHMPRADFAVLEVDKLLRPVNLAAQYALDMFFVMSGFLIAQMLLVEKARHGNISLGLFYARRAMRLLPAYYPAMLFLYLAQPSQVKEAVLDFRHILGTDWVFHLGFKNYWTNIFYFNNFLPWDHQFMGWSWTLAIEEQFYITFPLVLLFIYRMRWDVLKSFVWGFALSFVIRGLVVAFVLPHSDVQNALFIKPHTRFGSIQLGVIAAYLYLHVPDEAKRRRYARWMLVGPFVAVIAIILWKRTGVALGVRDLVVRSSHHYLVGCWLTWVVMITLEKNKGRIGAIATHVLSSRILFVVSQTSYSIYLLHLTLIGLIYRYLDDHHPFGLAVPTTPTQVLAWCVPFMIIAFVAALPMYLFVERPAMVLRNIWFRRPVAARETIETGPPN